MLIDFTPINEQQSRWEEFARRFTLTDLRSATHRSLDTILAILTDLDDAHLVFIPDDPDADDPHAPPEDRYLGWSLAHLVLHVTASSEENAAFSSLLARGVPLPRELRLRYERPWRHVTTHTEIIQRLEESRRIRLAYLDTWPDEPRLDVYREASPLFAEKHGKVNAIVAYLLGLRHESVHLPQFEKTAHQAREALQATAGD